MNKRLELLTSNDGTTISYQVLGQGPGLVMLSGASSSARNYLPLAMHLADQYTVYVVDRRGRKGSGPQGEGYSMEKECQDAIVLLEKTKATLLFGHSYGAIIALNVACRYPLTKIALYEPPVSVNNSIPFKWLTEFEQLLKEEDYLGAQVCIIKGLQMVKALTPMPLSQIKALFETHLTKDDVQEKKEILPTVPNEVREVLKLDSKSDQYMEVMADTLLLSGSESPDYLHQAIRTLESVLPHSETLVFPGLDHISPTEATEPIKKVIAQALKKFFG
jgi:pimeloyl-ACP methyl ester carboxylesterase